jgi:predicted RNA-binding Zn-ribbon protein involved in translation (DUF1610 family)
LQDGLGRDCGEAQLWKLRHGVGTLPKNSNAGSQQVAPMARSREIDLAKIQASLDKTCRKCGATITPDLVRRVDFERMECPKCGERFKPKAAE